MLSAEPRNSPTPVVRTPRGVVVVDGCSGGWRALAWASGYARARQLSTLGVVVYSRSWNRFCDATRAASLLSATIPEFNDADMRQELSAMVLRICTGSGVQPRVQHSDLRSWQDIARSLAEDQLDFVVLGSEGRLSGRSSRSAVSAFTKRGIPVTVVP